MRWLAAITFLTLNIYKAVCCLQNWKVISSPLKRFFTIDENDEKANDWSLNTSKCKGRMTCPWLSVASFNWTKDVTEALTSDTGAEYSQGSISSQKSETEKEGPFYTVKNTLHIYLLALPKTADWKYNFGRNVFVYHQRNHPGFEQVFVFAREYRIQNYIKQLFLFFRALILTLIVY